jgi:uncharacterized protein DUF2851
MREEILHFIWKHQYYRVSQVLTMDGESIQVLQQGAHNLNAGPDFEQAKLKIGEVEWNGAVEIHIKSSDWFKHKHQLDKAYNGVILHVVWENDKVAIREDGTALPTFEIKGVIDKHLLIKVEDLINTIETISCSSQLFTVDEIVIIDTIEKSLVKRLERKANLVLNELNDSNGDWSEVAYRNFMKQMGMKINGAAFYDLAKLLPYQLLRKYSHSQLSIEALLFGTSGLLESAKEDEYINLLKTEYQFLSHKHKLKKQLKTEQWKFLRLRPSNFPTIRLAQAATFLTNPTHIFELFTEFNQVSELTKKLKMGTSSYWKSHYRFGAKSNRIVPAFGKGSIDLLLLNVVSPLLATYSLHIDNQLYMDKAVKIAEFIKPEKNRIIREWKKVGVNSKNGAETQGLIELYNEHCIKKKCLGCGIGFSLLKK